MATDYSIARLARGGDASFLATAMQDARRRTLDLLDAYVARLGPELTIPYSTQLNPPRWEVGHVAWFHDVWIARNPQRHLGLAADPDCERPADRMPGADALYNSSLVKHATRWNFPLPDLAGTLGYLEASLAETLALLAARDLAVPARRWTLGYTEEDFAFDNELPAHAVKLDAFAIDSVAVSWRRFLPAIEAGAVGMPRTLRQEGGQWQALRYDTWEPLNLDAAAVHLTWDEAQAWCAWAGRRLPSEAEWECAVLSEPGFEWGDVWERTTSRFTLFAGFVAHSYRDYSRFSFEEHRYVLKGASRATDPRMAHPKYRNYFTPERNDLHLGFRSCARQ